MRGLWRGMAILLPLAGLAYSWHATRQSAAQGVEWDVAVRGYDPRDLLRGHYIRFAYVWPDDTPDAADGAAGNTGATRLCIEGEAPVIRRTTPMTDQDQIRDCQGIARAAGQDRSGDGTFARPASTIPREGRLFVPQSAAPGMERALADPGQQAILRFRLRPDGEIIPLRLSFQPQPVAGAQP
ncbi:GDYXXLXY domain-containing protein [Novosphingobium humi]|uniref:GDYXXLXY domain-containing protein n=1 Tax=Novosphingobium humi TaxID=2282397 RepID=A0ABY7TUD2_9SPHN|nr:GDYXXLXY domain-containing protein [Novosphingobium humi]WCT76847.1 GDYXXLXY domain-containing protein [Novosphingobium humi]